MPCVHLYTINHSVSVCRDLMWSPLTNKAYNDMGQLPCLCPHLNDMVCAVCSSDRYITHLVSGDKSLY